MSKFGFVSQGVMSLAVLTFLSTLQGAGGEDITNARENALSDLPVDTWGGVSSLFYSSVPNFPFGWAENLLLFQLTITAGSLIVFAEKNRRKSKKFKLAFLSFSYLALIFGSQPTRDGLMFSLGCLSSALLFGSKKIKLKWIRNVCACLGLTLIVFAFSFRPWISFSFSLVFAGWYYLKKNGKKTQRFLASLFIFALLPSMSISIELIARDIVNLRTLYPEQQVISMDLGAAYCWSVNPETARAAKEAISLLYSDGSPGDICESFKPQTWLWFTRKPILYGSTASTTFTFLTEKEATAYKDLRSRWLDIIISDPGSYIQNKYMFGSQVFIAGDSRNLRVLSSNHYSNSLRMDSFDLLTGLFLLPWDVVISLHLLSMNFSLVLWTLVVIGQYKKGKLRDYNSDLLYVCAFILWLGATVIAYIGDNGRYTYAASLALLFSLFLQNKNPSKQTFYSQEPSANK